MVRKRFSNSVGSKGWHVCVYIMSDKQTWMSDYEWNNAFTSPILFLTLALKRH